MSQKILIVLYYWPPAGGPGVQRWLKFIKYLPQFGIQPIVYCPENPNYPIIDKSLLNEIPKDVIVVKQPIKEPYRISKLFSKTNTTTISSGVIPHKKKQSVLQSIMLYVRGNFFIPDARKNWVKPSVTFLSQYVVKHKIDAVITTGPPHSLHLIGLQLKQRFGIKWAADFRDPWTTIGYHKSLKLTKASQQKHIELETEVLRTANEIIVTSTHTKNEFSSKTDRPITVITNGYDSHSVQVEEKDAQFSLAHIGSLLSERNPIILWSVLAELIKEQQDFAKQFQLNLVGVVSDEIIESIYSFSLKKHVNIIGYVSHQDAIKFQLKSQVLLLVEIDSEDTKAIIPGKIFEYLISETPILAIGPKGSDIETIIKNTNTGSYFTYDEKEELKAQILDYYNAFKTKTLKTNPIGLQQYSRKALTKLLSNVILRLANQ